MQTCGNTVYCTMSLNKCMGWPMQFSPPSCFLQSQIFSCLDILEFSTKMKIPDFSGSRKIWFNFEPEFSGTRKRPALYRVPKNLVQKWTRFFGNPKNLFFFSFVENSKISKQLNICDCKKPEGILNCIGQSTHLFSEIVQYTVLPRVCMCMIPQHSCCKFDAACENNCEC